MFSGCGAGDEPVRMIGSIGSDNERFVGSVASEEKRSTKEDDSPVVDGATKWRRTEVRGRAATVCRAEQFTEAHQACMRLTFVSQIVGEQIGRRKIKRRDMLEASTLSNLCTERFAELSEIDQRNRNRSAKSICEIDQRNDG